MKQGQTTKIANKIVIAISHPEKPLHKVKKLLKHSDFRENNAPYNLWPITSNGMSYFQMRIVSSTVYTKLYHKIIVYFLCSDVKDNSDTMQITKSFTFARPLSHSEGTAF